MNDLIAPIGLTKKELSHCINDIISYKNDLLEKVVGTCDITQQEIYKLPEEKLDELRIYGYFSRMLLLEKLQMFERIYFSQYTMAG
jgi:hypothetical protein